jgi:hypothetical protein
VVLIDDSAFNVDVARSHGYHAFHCPEGLTAEWFATQGELKQLLRI